MEASDTGRPEDGTLTRYAENDILAAGGLTISRTYDDVMRPLQATDDELTAAQRAVFERAYALAAQIAALREERGLTQLQLAALAGVDQAAVSKIERGVTHPSSRTLHRVAEALGAALHLVELAGT